MDRKGEKIGWIAGWLGGFCWLGIMAIIWFFQNKPIQGSITALFFIAAVILIITVTPWRFPNTKYWKLMLPLYGLLIISVGLAIYFWGGFGRAGLTWISTVWIIPLWIPFISAGKMTWNSASGGQKPL